MQNTTTAQQFTARLQDKKMLSEKLVQLSFELVHPNAIIFQAGQHVSIKINDQGDFRPYSIVTSPEITHGFDLLIDLEPDGIGTRYLNALQLGEEIIITGPLGSFVLDPNDPEFVFVANGLGVAPFRSMILQLLQQLHTTKKITLFWGLRLVTDMIWQNEFQELMSAFPNFKFHPTLSQSPVEWPLCRGRVTNCLAVHEIPTSAKYYLCGSSEMIDEVAALLQKRGISATNINYEKYR